MTTAIIELDYFQKDFGKFAALKDTSSTLALGQILGFLGPNGAGKSTTTRVILGLLKKSGDSAVVSSEDAWRDDVTIHPHITYILGDVYLQPNLLDSEIVGLLLHLNGRRYNQKTDELVKAFESDPEKKARTYLKGNCQEVVLIAALS